MREYIDLKASANLVSMLRSQVDGALCLADDDEEARFYEQCAHETALVVAAPRMAVSLLEVVEDRGVEGVVATVRGVRAREEVRDNVFQPAVGDVASLLLLSGAFRRVMTDIVGVAWLNACERDVGPLRDRAVRVGRLLGRLRDAYVGANLTPPTVRDLVEQFVEWTTFDVWSTRGRVVADASGVSLPIVEEGKVPLRASNIRADLVDCDGMDAIAVLVAATRLFRPRGIKAAREVDETSLMGMLRVAFELEELESDEIFWRISQWQRRNRRWRLLRAWRRLDPLQVLLEQGYWERDLATMIRLMEADGWLAAFKMDLDNFKRVNDTLGHMEGDAAIRLYCQVVQAVLGEFGEVYRRGGDEVVALAPGLGEDEAQRLAERVRTRIEREFEAWGTARGLSTCPTASIGVAVIEGRRATEEVARLMDAAQQQAKQRKNYVCCSVTRLGL